MTIASLIVQVSANTVQLVQDVEKIHGSLNRVVSMAGNVAGALGVAFSAQALVGFGRQVIADADALIKMRDKTQITIEGLQRLQFVGDDAGNTLEQITASVNMLQKRLVTDSDSVVPALTTLGLRLEFLRLMAPDQQFMAIGDAIARIEDPAQRVAIAVALFGRSGAEVLPSLIRGFEDVRSATIGMSESTAVALDSAGDTLTRFWRRMKAVMAETIVGLAFIPRDMATALTPVAAPPSGLVGGAQGDRLSPTDYAALHVPMMRVNAGIQAIAISKEQEAAVTKVLTSTYRDHHEQSVQAAAAAEKLVESQRRFRESATSLLNGPMRGLIATVPDLSTRTGDFRRELSLLSSTSNEMHRGLTIAGDHMRTVTIPAFGELATVVPQGTAAIREAMSDDWRPKDTWTKTLTTSLSAMPAMISNAFTGGGGISGAAQGAASMLGSNVLTKGLAGLTKNMTGMLGEVMGAAIPVIGSLVGPAIQGIVSLFKKPEYKKIMKDSGRDWGVSFSESLAKEIEATEKKLNLGRLAASLMSLDKIIGEAGGLTARNLTFFTGKLRDVFSMIETRQLSVAQGTQVLNANWAAFVAAGTDGSGRISAGLREIVALNDRMGTQSQAITAWQRQQAESAVSGFAAVAAATSFAMDATGVYAGSIAAAKLELDDLGLQAVAAYTAAVAAGASIPETLQQIGPSLLRLAGQYESLGLSVDSVALKSLLLQNKIMQGTPALMGAISGLTLEMVSLDNIGLLTVETFDAMQRTGVALYTRLQGEVANFGGSTRDALLPMQAWLRDAARQAELLGVPLASNTAEMIAQSRELGLWQTEGRNATDLLIGAMGTLVDRVGQLIDQLNGVNGEMRALPGTLPNPFSNWDLPEGVRAFWDRWFGGPPPGFGSYAAGGGLVTSHGITQYFAGGGTVLPFRPRGTDTVPAMLTPGERVLTRRETAAYDAGTRRGGSDFGGMQTEIQGLRSDLRQQARRQASETFLAVRDALVQAGRR